MFSSKEEFAKAMIDGRVFKRGRTTFYAKWECPDDDKWPGRLKFYWKGAGEQHEIQDFWKVYWEVAEVLPWYERIPEQKILCWVWDKDKKAASPQIVIGYVLEDGYPFVTGCSRWRNAEPITLDEAKKLIVEE